MLPPLSSMLSRLRLKQLRLLVALADHGSLLRAAEHVGLTQPGASKSLQEIESALGTELFLRTNRGLEPNDIGHCVIRYARLIETDLAHLREDMLGILQGHGGRLSVGVIMGAVPLLTEALSRLLEKRPALSVEIVEDTSGHLLTLLDEGRLDLAICRTSISQRPHLYDSIDIHDEQLAVVANVKHPLAGRKRIALPDLANFRWVVYSANMPMRLLLEREFHESGLRFPLYLLETTSAFTTLSLLQRNPSMVALLSVDVARFCTRFGMTTILPLQLQSRSEPYQLVSRSNSVLSPVAKLFVEEFRAAPDAR
ncbi:LysR family transcriptional regulator [Noviherbaspirillum pedocola]|uniref:LysR family transcriptional regulator n=1 Tax=Noviherbaspirillum pedocola TaxID=2801341 RepID=A0A934STB1_9BURK|nr:LysR family transcriptional regulator [Noviherbaspirillum pedocola]MBK4735065.1 LysR family transcriptional regulator [Noviherbaspirillum pedocola]